MTIPGSLDHRYLRPRQIVRIREDADTPYRGLLAVLSGVGDESVVALVCVLGEDPVLLALPRLAVEVPGYHRR